MCGIVGFITRRDFSSLQADLPEAVSRLSHRGPDDSGLFFDEKAGVGLGHRRLSILDLSVLGRQPMGSDGGEIKMAIVSGGNSMEFINRDVGKFLVDGDIFKVNNYTFKYSAT